MISKIYKWKIFSLLLVTIIFLQLFCIIFFQRELFTNKYDVSYSKDRFEHSQWTLPLSTRPIGDSSLYSYVGYQMVKGQDPALVNVETPPLGKYLIGFTIALFHNEALFGLINIVIFLIAFYFFTKKIIKNSLLALFLTIIVFLDPLIFSQSWLAMLDLLQLNFLLINFTAVLYLRSKHQLFLSIIAGISLGFFFDVKFPILFPLIYILEGIYFVFLRKKYLNFIIFNFTILLSIFLPYLKFFLNGHNFIDFLKLQKFILNFYYISNLKPHFEAVWSVLLLGNYPNIVTRIPEKISEFNLFWPFITILSVLFFIVSFRNEERDKFSIGIAIFIIGSFFIFIFIPFYSRYLIILLPFLYLYALRYLRIILPKKINILLFLITVIALINSTLFLIPKPEDRLRNFYQNFSNQNFQDVYKEDLSSSRNNLTQDNFHKLSKQFFNDATIKSINMKEIKKERISNNKYEVKVKINYFTQYLGSFSEIKNINLVKESSKWKVVWDWNILLNGLTSSDSVITTRNLGKRGILITKVGKIIAKDEMGYIFSVNPRTFDASKETEMLDLLSSITRKDPVGLQNAYLIDNTLGFVDLGTSFVILPRQLSKLARYKGVKIKPYPARIYYSDDPRSINNTSFLECCTRIYSSYNYHGVRGLEKKYDAQLWGYDGGNIKIIDEKGIVRRIILEKKKKDGQNVIVDTL